VTVLCLVEREGDGLAAASLAAVSFARTLAAAGDADLTAVVFGAGASPAGLDGIVTGVCQVTAPGRLAGYAPQAWARALQQMIESSQASAVVAAATDRGSEVLAHLGAVTGLPVAANCVSALPQAVGSWQLVRQRWAGSVLEEAVLNAPTALLTVAADAAPAAAVPGPAMPGTAMPGADPPGAAAQTGPVLTTFEPELDDADLLAQAVESAGRSAGASLATARVVVGGGRGVGGAEGFAPLEELAAQLGGVVGVSRVVTSAGWRPHRQQVGQTGTKISPELYLACGISGAIQHMAGCMTARHIIVVNTDPDAPIISRADYAVIADLHELIPALVEAIRDRASGAAPVDAPAAGAAGASTTAL
jgi:electron transfer flavoprotein alpha subunit